MQFKILSTLAVALSVQSTAYAMSPAQQAQAVRRDQAIDQSQAMGQAQAMDQSQAMKQDQAMQQGQAVLTSQDVINTLNDISKLFSDVSGTLAHISAENLGSDIPKIISSVSGLIGTLSQDVGDFFNPLTPGSFSREDQLSICDAFNSFLASNDKFVNDIIGPEGLFARSFLKPIISIVLKVIEGLVNSFAKGIVGAAPACESQAQSELKKLLGFANGA